MSDEVLVTGSETNAPGNETKPDSATAPEGLGEAAKTGDKPADDAAEKKGEEGKPAADKAAEVPESYDFKVPEGMTLDAEKAKAFSEIAKGAKLSQADAQKLLDMYVADKAAGVESHKQMLAGWAQETKALKDIGGDKLAETIAIANKAVDLGPPELKAFLKDTGLGNHPLFVRWAHAIGKKVAEDTVVQGGDAGTQRNAAKVLFPGMA